MRYNFQPLANYIPYTIKKCIMSTFIGVGVSVAGCIASKAMVRDYYSRELDAHLLDDQNISSVVHSRTKIGCIISTISGVVIATDLMFSQNSEIANDNRFLSDDEIATTLSLNTHDDPTY